MSDQGKDPVSGLRLMVSDMLRAEAAGLHFPALITALALPDICGALGSDSGRSSGAKTRRWISEWLPVSGQNAAGIYGLRCSLLHQGSPYPDDGSPRVAFSVMGLTDVSLHGPAASLVFQPTGEAITPIALREFVREVADGVSRWLARYEQTDIVRKNAQRFAHLRHNGVPPFIGGGSFIA